MSIQFASSIFICAADGSTGVKFAVGSEPADFTGAYGLIGALFTRASDEPDNPGCDATVGG